VSELSEVDKRDYDHCRNNIENTSALPNKSSESGKSFQPTPLV